MRKSISLFILSAVAICLTSMNALAITYKGAGTEADPYQIETAEEFDGIRDHLNSPSVYFKIMNDIDFTDFLASTETGWEAIGSEVNNHFKGTLDGNNKVLSNLWVDGGGDGAGVFGRLGKPGIIKNVIIEDANFTVGRWCGILVSSNGTWEYEGGTILNCIVRNSRIEGVTCLGAIVGANGSVVENCAAIDVDVSATQKSIGALIGENGQSASLVKNCYSSGIVSGVDETGGLIGQHSASAVNAVEGCYSYAFVYGGTNTGGLIGYCNAPVKNSFASGDVEGQSAGGLIGAPLTKNIENCYATGNVLGLPGNDQFSGGLVGAMYDCNATNCYFAGTHEGSARGGFADRAIRNVFTNCYFNSTTTGAENAIGEGESYSGDIIALTDTEMKTKEKMSGLFSAAIWEIWEGNSYPYFNTQSAAPVLTSVTTTKVTGSYKNVTTESLTIYTLDYGTIDITDLKIANNVWEATITANQIKENDLVYVYLKESDKASSYAVYGVAQKGASIELNNEEMDVKIYPNPATDYVKIASSYVNFDVSIFNSVGKLVVAEKNVNADSEIGVSTLPTGIYYVTVATPEAKETQKLIVK